METDLIKLIGQGAFGAALLGLIYVIGTRMVAAIDRVAAKDEEQTKAINELRTDIAILAELLHRVIGGAVPRRNTNPTGVPIVSREP